MIIKRFIIKQNYSHWQVIDTDNNKKIVVGYHNKIYAELTAKGLNRLNSEFLTQKMIKSLKTVKGYGKFINNN